MAMLELVHTAPDWTGALGVAPLVIAAVAVQVASPWAGPVSPVGRPGHLPRAPRVRYRYA